MCVCMCVLVYICACTSGVCTCVVPNSLSRAAAVQCCHLPLQPPPCPSTVGPTHSQPEWEVSIFTHHPVLFDVDFSTLIEEDPCLSAVELPMEDEGLPQEGTASPHPQ